MAFENFSTEMIVTEGVTKGSGPPLEVWKQHAHRPVTGKALDSRHYLAEEQPEEVLQELLQFFKA